MRRWMVVLLATVLTGGLFLVPAGCLVKEEVLVEEKFEEFDQEALVAVDSYIEEMGEAMLDVIPDLQGWVREHYSDDLPLRYDEERRQWLAEHRSGLEALREEHLGGDFPTEGEIAGWEVVVERGEREWLLEGHVVLDSLNLLDTLYAEVTGAIDLVLASEGELNMAQSLELLELIDRIEPALGQIETLFYGSGR